MRERSLRYKASEFGTFDLVEVKTQFHQEMASILFFSCMLILPGNIHSGPTKKEGISWNHFMEPFSTLNNNCIDKVFSFINLEDAGSIRLDEDEENLINNVYWQIYWSLNVTESL